MSRLSYNFHTLQDIYLDLDDQKRIDRDHYKIFQRNIAMGVQLLSEGFRILNELKFRLERLSSKFLFV